MGEMLILAWIISFGLCAPDQCPTECSCYQSKSPGGTTVNCTERDLSSSVKLQLPDNTHTLELSYNKLSSLENLITTEFLRELHVDHNDIEDIEKDLMLTTSQLEVLDLSYNRLRAVPENLPLTIRVLHLSHNQIDHIYHSTFTILSQLTELHLDGNLLTDIDMLSFGAHLEQRILPNLSKLALNNNKLGEIGERSFLQLNNLKALSLSSNNLSGLSAGIFEGLKKLEFLDLSDNAIKGIANNTFKDLYSLKYVHLRLNSLPNVPRGLPYLDWLDLSHNHIRFVNETESNKDIYPIEIINLAHNPLHCDCHMLWLKELWDRREYIIKYSEVIVPENFVPKCSSPDNLAEDSWDMLGDYVFKCPEDENLEAKTLKKPWHEQEYTEHGNLGESLLEEPYKKDIKKTSNINPNLEPSHKTDNNYPQFHIGLGKVSKDSITIHWRSKSAESITWVYVQYYIFGQRAETSMFAQISFSSGRYTVKNLLPQTNYIVCVIPKISDEILPNTNLDQCIEAQTSAQSQWWQNIIPDEKSLTYHIKLFLCCGLTSVVIVGIGVFIYEVANSKFWSAKEHDE